MNYLAGILLVFLSLTLNAQIEIGQWREHLPYHEGQKVTYSATEVFMTTGKGVLRYDKENKEVAKWSKVNGLSDNGASVVRYSNDYNTLVIGYANGNIDLMINDRITNVSDIKRFPITGDKEIYEITIKDHLAYFSCGFGIVVMDIQRMEIKDTYYIGDNASYLKVNEVTFTEDKIFAATESGIFWANLNSPNLADYNNWTREASVIDSEITSIAYFQNKVYAGIEREGFGNDSIVFFDDDSWQGWETISYDVFNIKANENYLMISGNYSGKVYSDHSTLAYNFYTYGNSSPQPNEIIEEEGVFWIADRYSGLVRALNPWNNEKIVPNSPKYEYAYCLDAEGGAVWFGNGSRSETWTSTWNRQSACRFENEQWRSYNLGSQVTDTIWDIVDVEIDPNDPSHVYLSSWGRGLVEVKDGEVQNIFREHNSTIGPREGVSFYSVLVGGIEFDNQGNLWIANGQTSDVISVRMADGSFDSFNLGTTAGLDTYAGELLVHNNQIWMIKGRGNGIAVFDHKGTIDDHNDDEYQTISGGVGSGALPSMNVLSFAKDKDEEIWIGTDKGIAVIYSPENIFSGSNSWDAQQILIQQDGHWQNLLESDAVTAIYVDGANRKWIGTSSSGVYLMSEDGQEEILHFTEDNSPLLSDAIQSITINEETGEVYFGTDKGLVSYRGTATEGEDSFGEVYAFPNPVQPGYTGTIGIKGLVENAEVKITDINGQVIFETLARGGLANWDGYSLNGDKASSGVYLVFASNEDGEKTIVTKILIVN